VKRLAGQGEFVEAVLLTDAGELGGFVGFGKGVGIELVVGVAHVFLCARFREVKRIRLIVKVYRTASLATWR
jgi:hypothetical protein